MLAVTRRTVVADYSHCEYSSPIGSATTASRENEMTQTIKINGVTTEVPAGAVAYKHADPTEDARWIYDANEARDIEKEDPSLIVYAK